MQAATEKQRQEIREGFYSDVFVIIASGQGDPQKTAYEVAQAKEEKLIQISPLVQNFETEGLARNADRAFSIMMENGEFPPPPDELRGVRLKVEYDSILALAGRAVGLQPLERWITNVIGMANDSQDPSVLDKVDFDQAADAMATFLDVTPSVVRSDDQVAARRTQRAQQEQAAQGVEQAQGLASAAKDASQADLGGDNVLARLMEG
jgi:hypothetical protein